LPPPQNSKNEVIKKKSQDQQAPGPIRQGAHKAQRALIPSTHLRFSHFQSSHVQFANLQLVHLQLPGFPVALWRKIDGFQCFSDDPIGFIKNGSTYILLNQQRVLLNQQRICLTSNAFCLTSNAFCLTRIEFY